MVFNRFSSLLFLSLVAPSALAASANDWRSRSIYQLVTDRFARDDGTTPQCDPQERKYCGGTWKGITGKLDYIQNMGFDAVWISPVVQNVNGTTAYGEAYHGYWTSDINALNTNYGTADDLKALSSALHSRGMYLMVDVVVNHFVPSNGSGIDPTNNLNTTFDFRSVTPFNSTASYHPYCIINDYTNQTDVEQCWLGDDKLPLPDLNTEDQNNVDTMYNWIQNLVQTYNFDGVRIDTVKHVRKDFWPGFRDKAGVFTIGEVLNDDPAYTGDYTKVLDAVLDYPTYFPLFTSFISPSGNLSALIDLATRSQSAYSNASSVAGSFLENHDQVRFQSAQTDMALVKNAMTWPFIQDGIPILYYGQEQGYAGGADPGNREALWSSNYNPANPLYTHAKTLNAVRKAAITSNSGFFSTPAKFIALSTSTTSNPSTIAVSKPPLLTLLTNAGSNASDVSWTITKDQNLFQKGEKVVDLLTCNTLTADSDGGLTVKASGANPQVLIPVSALSKSSGICTDAAAGKSNGAAQLSSLSFKPAFVGMAIALGFMFL